MDRLIADYHFELSEAACSPGLGRYGLLVIVPGSISAVFPYLNAVLEDTWYDHQNQVLIGSESGRRYAFRAGEIRVAGMADAADAPQIAREVTDRVSQAWHDRGRISACFSERKLPAVIDIYQFLPKTNCKQCGYATCLVFAAELGGNPELMAQCPPLSQPEYADSRAQIGRLFSLD